MNTIIATFYLSLNDADTVNARSGFFTITSGKSTLTFSLPNHSGLKAGTHIVQARLRDEVWYVDSVTPTTPILAATTADKPTADKPTADKPTTPTDALVNAMAKAEKVEPPTVKETPTSNEGKSVEKPHVATPPVTRAPVTPPAAAKRAAPITPPKNLRSRAANQSAPTSPANSARSSTPPTPPVAKRPAPITPPAKQPKQQSLGGFSTKQTDNTPASGGRESVMHTDAWDDSDDIPF